MKAIWVKDLYEEKNITVTFQYRFVPSADTVLTVAASNLYRLFINGELRGYGPARAAHGFSRTDSYMLGDHSGDDTVISVEVFSANTNTFYIIDEPPFFAAEIRMGGALVAEAPDFTAYRMTERVQKVRRFGFQRAYSEYYRLSGDPYAFYAGKTEGREASETSDVPMNRLLPRHTHMPKLNKIYPVEAEYGTVGIDDDPGRIDHFDFMEVNGTSIKGFRDDEFEVDVIGYVWSLLYSAENSGKAEKLSDMQYQLYDFGRICTGFFGFNVTAAADTELTLIFDEVICDRENSRKLDPLRNSCCNYIHYELPAGESRIISFEANTARYVAMVVKRGEAKIDDLGLILYENPDAASFEYDYGDYSLNKITEAAVNTFAQNAVDILTDCPSRERAGWLCDSYFSSRAEALFTGKNLVEKSFLENYAVSPKLPHLPEGMIPMCYPADHNDGNYIPNWSMWYILELRNYVKRTGDEKMREASRGKVYGLVKFFERFENEYELLEDLEKWVFVEWSMCNDREYVRGVNYPSNMLWAAALDAVDDLYGDPSLRQKAERMRKAIRKLSFNGRFFEDNSIRDEKGALQKTAHTTETCQYYAFYFDVASPEDYPELFDLMLGSFGPKRDPEKTFPTVYPSNAIVGNYLRLEILLRLGLKDRVLDECRDFFLGMAELTGTLWEHSSLTASLNHGFASMAAVYIHECFYPQSEKTLLSDHK